jgi:hypothetical protein
MRKTYTKIIDNKQVIKPANKITIHKDGMVTYNPTDEMILADGWEEYVIPEPTDIEKFIQAQQSLRHEIKRYDTSDAVNEFYVSDIPVWLDKNTRAGLLLRFQAEKAQGIEDTTLWYNSMQFPLKVENAIAMLYAIELYASACYDNTQRHLAEVEKLETFESVENYDYTIGYPDKLYF